MSDKIPENVKDVAPVRKLADSELEAVCGGAGEMTPPVDIDPDRGRKHHGNHGKHKGQNK